MGNLQEERHRMESGEWFDATGQALAEARDATRRALMRFNGDASLTDGQRTDLLRSLVGGLGDGAAIMPGVQMDYGFNVFLGQRSFVNFNAVFLDGAPITLGDDVWVGPNSTFATPLHPLLPRERVPRAQPGQVPAVPERNLAITVESDVWIASNVTVNPGVTIGEGAVIGSGSVVTRDIPAHTLAFGSPCRPVRAITDADSVRQALAEAGIA